MMYRWRRFNFTNCSCVSLPSVLWRCWLGGRKGIRPVKNLSGGALAWLSVWSEVQTCTWPSWCHCHSLFLNRDNRLTQLLPSDHLQHCEVSSPETAIKIWTDIMSMPSSMKSSIVLCYKINKLTYWLSQLLTHSFNDPLSGTTRVSRYQKGKTNLDFSEAKTVSGSGIGWTICKSEPRSKQITAPAPHHSVFTGRMPFLPSNQQHPSTKGKT